MASASNQIPDYVNNSTNLYFLHPNENSRLELVSLVLSGPNYHSKSRVMKMALQSKNEVKFIDGSLKMPKHTNPNVCRLGKM